MLEVREHGPVISFRAARSILGHAFYHTAAYWVDGLLVDTTCAYTARELLDALSARTLTVEQVVNTHCHEDHIGANGLVQQMFGVPVLAHPLALPILAEPKLQYLQPYRRFFWGWPKPSPRPASGGMGGDRALPLSGAAHTGAQPRPYLSL